jgi:hypothetical protein
MRVTKSNEDAMTQKRTNDVSVDESNPHEQLDEEGKRCRFWLWGIFSDNRDVYQYRRFTTGTHHVTGDII